MTRSGGASRRGGERSDPADPPPDPTGASDLDELAERLQALRQWAGLPSFTQIAARIGQLRIARGVAEELATPGRVTVYDCFRPGRARLDPRLLADIVAALAGPDHVAAWRRALSDIERSARTTHLAGIESPPAPATTHFVGREAELIALLRPDAPRTSLLVGMPGAGKSELARRAAERILARQRGRGYLINLHGYDHDQPPVTVHTALGALLRAYGVGDTEIVRLDLAARIARCRTLTTSSTLIVLDNLRDPGDAAVLLSALVPARLLLTSRRSFAPPPELAGSWQELEIGLFGVEQSLELLHRLAPAARLGREPAMSRRLVALCGGLPLHLAIAGGRLAETPDWSLADQVRRLESVPAEQTLQRALAASYSQLAPDAGRLFRYLALHPGEAMTTWAAAALAGLATDAAERGLALLAAEHLVAPDGPHRVRLHDLVRDYAAQLGRELDRHSEREAALVRLLDHYRVSADRACRHLRRSEAPPSAPDGVPVPPLPDRDSAHAWLKLESTNLVSAALAGADLGLLDEVAGVAAAVAPWLDAEVALTEAALLHDRAAHAPDRTLRTTAARNLARTHDTAGNAPAALEWAEYAVAESPPESLVAALIDLAGARLRLGDLADGRADLVRAVATARELGSRLDEGRALAALALADQFLGDFASSDAGFDRAMELARECGDDETVATVLTDRAYHALVTESWAEAEELLRRSLSAWDRLGFRTRRSYSLAQLGLIRAAQGALEEGLALTLDGLRDAQELRLDWAIGGCWCVRADVERLLGRIPEGLASAGHALEVAEQLDSDWGRMEAHNSFGELFLDDGDPDAAERHFDRAREIADRMGEPFEGARARHGLGECAATRGDTTTAVQRWREAVERYARLGNPQAEHLSDRIARAGVPSPDGPPA